MKKKELIDLYYQIEEAYHERQKLGEFDANSKHIMVLLEGLMKTVIHSIDDHGRFVVVPKIKKGAPKK